MLKIILTGLMYLIPIFGVNLKEEYSNTTIENVLHQLESAFIGLRPVKKRIKEIAALLLIQRLREKFALKSTSSRIGLHMSFTGNPGTGKTEIAVRMADILYKLGYIQKGHLISVTRDDLVGQYIGHTAPKTKAVLKRAIGGVLFIDEAYYLYKADNERDYGSEAIEILLQVMENQRENLVVIFAGYKDRMDEFYKSNPGLSSRVSNHINFPDYSPEELFKIGKLFLEEQQYLLTPEAEDVFIKCIEKCIKMPSFANVRTVINIIDQSRLRQAKRLFDSGTHGKASLTKLDLVTLLPEDIMEC
jgi:probable Rubsico expression protein CbbX